MGNRRTEISIGVPVYNGKTFLEERQYLLLGQIFGDFELLVLDNAFTDGTEEIAGRFVARDARVRYHRHAENLGLAAKYNDLVQMASAERFKANDVCGVIRRAVLLHTRVLPLYRGGDAFLGGALPPGGASSGCQTSFLWRRLHPKASSHMGRPREIARADDRPEGGIMPPEWQRVRDHLSTVVRSELQLRGKVAFLGGLAGQTFRRRERLLSGATHAVRTGE